MLQGFRFHIKLFSVVSVLCVVIMPLAGCSMFWMDLDKDPFAFIYSSDEEEQTQSDNANILANVPPLQPESGGTLGALGLNLETYLSPELKDPRDRIKRLENVVIAIQRDLGRLVPSMQSLASMESNLKNHIKNNNLDDSVSNAATLEPQYILNPKYDPQQTPIGKGSKNHPPSADVPIVTGIRVGEHPDKVRVVFDVTKKTTYSVDLDNNENILVVEMPNVQWNLPVSNESFGNTPVLRSYKVDSFNNGQGQIFVLQLKQDTSILSQGKYPALSGSGERIVVDLRK